MKLISWLAVAAALVFTSEWILPVMASGPADVKQSTSSAVERLVDAPQPKPYYSWPSTPPAGCPFQKSDTLVGVGFTGRHAEYTGADTWYPSWAADGNLYSPWTDGNVNGLGSSSGGENATTGHATILGDDPLNLAVTNQGVFKSSPRPYEGRYPCGSLVYDGVWYYGTYCLHPSGGVTNEGTLYNWPWLGPFVGFPLVHRFGQDVDADALHPREAALRRARAQGRAGQDQRAAFR